MDQRSERIKSWQWMLVVAVCCWAGFLGILLFAPLTSSAGAGLGALAGNGILAIFFTFMLRRVERRSGLGR